MRLPPLLPTTARSFLIIRKSLLTTVLSEMTEKDTFFLALYSLAEVFVAFCPERPVAF